MSDFVNTIDVLGDEEVLDSLIDRSVTEMNDDVLNILAEFAFAGCASLISVNLPSVRTAKEQVFSNCSKLTDVNLPSLTSFGGYAFYNCTNLKNLNCPSLTAIGAEVIMNCNSITSIKFPLLSSVGYGHIKGCKKLAYIEYGLRVSFGDTTFNDCTALTALVLRSETMCNATVSILNNTPIASGTGYIYVPSALIDSYKAATNWSTYATQFRALEDYTVDGTITGELDESKI